VLGSYFEMCLAVISPDFALGPPPSILDILDSIVAQHSPTEYWCTLILYEINLCTAHILTQIDNTSCSESSPQVSFDASLTTSLHGGSPASADNGAQSCLSHRRQCDEY